MNKEAVYRELCSEVRSADDVSFKLLALALLVTGAGIALAVHGAALRLAPLYPTPLFGSLIILGLFRWELRNIQICIAAIRSVRMLEDTVPHV